MKELNIQSQKQITGAGTFKVSYETIGCVAGGTIGGVLGSKVSDAAAIAGTGIGCLIGGSLANWLTSSASTIPGYQPISTYSQSGNDGRHDSYGGSGGTYAGGTFDGGNHPSSYYC
ncbi:MAG: hypothetical protein ACRCV6_07570 [Formosimonas sp.]